MAKKPRRNGAANYAGCGETRKLMFSLAACPGGAGVR